MNKSASYSKVLTWFMALLLVALAAGCGGGGGGRDPILGTGLPGLVSVAVTPATASIPIGAPQQFIATATFADGSSSIVTANPGTAWTSGTLAVATMSLNGVGGGVATGVAVGTSIITANFGGKAGSATLTVTPATLVSIAVVPATASIPIGGTQTFVATGIFSDGIPRNVSTTVTWASNNTPVATVVSPGVARGESAGIATITASSPGATSGSAALTVTNATLVSITVAPPAATVPIGGTQTFVATGNFSDGIPRNVSTTVTWASNNTPVATVVSPGVARGESAGIATITASSPGATSGSAALTVINATLVSITVAPPAATVPIGGTQTFVATGNFSDGIPRNVSTTVTWASNNTPVATVVSPGVARGESAGIATITASSPGATSGSAALTVTNTPVALGPAPVPLESAGNFVILTKSGITNVHTSAITGNIGTSPITAAAMDNVFCSEITGTIFGVDAAYTGSGATTCFAGNPGVPAVVPPDANKTLVDVAVLDMGTAFTNAAGRTNPDFTELGGGNISGLTLVPGLYKWGTGVLITNAGVTLAGGPDDVWIFQVGVDLTVNNGAIVTLIGGARAKNVFWQVEGQATLGTTADFKGIILARTLISLGTGAVVNSRLFAQTQVTLQQNIVTPPAP